LPHDGNGRPPSKARLISRLSVKALAIGVCVDLFGSALFGALIGIVLRGAISGRGGPPGRPAEASAGMVLFLGVDLIGGLGFTILGGLAAGRIAGEGEILHGALIGIPSLILGLAFGGSEPTWFQLTSLILVVPAGALGGLLAAVRSKRGLQKEGAGSRRLRDSGREGHQE
jgi:hypothetical protein